MSDRPLAETSTCTTDNTYKRQTSMPPAGFEPAIPASDQLPTHSLDRKPTNLVPHLTLTYPWIIYLQAWLKRDQPWWAQSQVILTNQISCLHV